MDIYKKAVFAKLRFNTAHGVLNLEKLVDLTKEQLEVEIQKQYKLLTDNGSPDELSFLDSVNKIDLTEQLRFDILKDLFLTKKEELRQADIQKEQNEYNRKIMAVIHERQEKDFEKSLYEMPIEDLKKLLK